MVIAQTDSALVRLLADCNFPGVSVFSAPHAWDDGFIQGLITEAPALLVSFIGGEEYAGDKSVTLNLDGKWEIYAVSGWNGRNQEERRKGAGAGFDLMGRAAGVLHTAWLTDEHGERLAQSFVEGLGVEADSAIDISNLWVGTIALSVELPLPLLESEGCFGPLDDFLEARATFDIEGGEPLPDIADAGTLGDFPARVDLEQ